MANFVENDCVTGGLFLWLLHLKIGRVYLEVGSPAVYSQRCYYIILSFLFGLQLFIRIVIPATSTFLSLTHLKCHTT